MVPEPPADNPSEVGQAPLLALPPDPPPPSAPQIQVGLGLAAIAFAQLTSWILMFASDRLINPHSQLQQYLAGEEISNADRKFEALPIIFLFGVYPALLFFALKVIAGHEFRPLAIVKAAVPAILASAILAFLISPAQLEIFIPAAIMLSAIQTGLTLSVLRDDLSGDNGEIEE